MSRIVLDKGCQRTFLNRVYAKSGLDWSHIANICSVSERTIRDWRREKFYMKYESAQALSEKTSVSLWRSKKILPDYWNTKKAAPIGAKRRYEIYGNPGTVEGRKKGGINSQMKFRKNPDYAKNLGIKIKKIIHKPKDSSDLAEFIGILLGDGGLTEYYATVSLNRETDKEYSLYVQKLIRKLFGILSSIISGKSKNDKADRIVVYSKDLIEFLLDKGLDTGNKMHNKVNIPYWIKEKKEFKKACVRGLIDTDGSFYSYKHKVNNKVYSNFAMCFTSYSTLLLNSVHNILKELNFRPSKNDKRLYLHRKKDIESYINVVGSHNPKHINKYKKERYGSGHNRTVSKTV